jgi:hypothetical protein
MERFETKDGIEREWRSDNPERRANSRLSGLEFNRVYQRQNWLVTS